MSVVDLGARVVDVACEDVDDDVASWVAVSVEYLVGLAVTVSEECVVRWDDHRSERCVAVCRRVTDVDRSFDDLSRRDELNFAVANGRLKTTGSCELFAEEFGVAALCECFETRCGSFACGEEVEVSVVEAYPCFGEEEAALWLKVLNRELACLRIVGWFGLRTSSSWCHRHSCCQEGQCDDCSPHPSCPTHELFHLRFSPSLKGERKLPPPISKGGDPGHTTHIPRTGLMIYERATNSLSGGEVHTDF